MRRVITTLAIVAILLSSCGGNDIPAGLATTLQERVASVRELAEAGKPGLALARLRNMVALVSSQLDRGRIDEGWGMEILESAEAVGTQLSLLPQPSPTQSPSPSPSQEEGSSGDGDGNGKGKGKGDEGHGNDE